MEKEQQNQLEIIITNTSHPPPRFRTPCVKSWNNVASACRKQNNGKQTFQETVIILPLGTLVKAEILHFSAIGPLSWRIVEAASCAW